MDKRGDIFIDGTQKMSAALDNGDVYAAFRQVFHRAQGKNPVAFTIVRRQNGVRARREDKFVVMRFKRFARA